MIKKLLNGIETIPYNIPVGIVYESGNVVTGFWYDIGREKWLKLMVTPGGDKPICWFNLGDLHKAYIEDIK